MVKDAKGSVGARDWEEDGVTSTCRHSGLEETHKEDLQDKELKKQTTGLVLILQLSFGNSRVQGRRGLRESSEPGLCSLTTWDALKDQGQAEIFPKGLLPF